MKYQTAINCLAERIHLREIQEKEHVQEGHHFDAQECRRQINDQQAAIQGLQGLNSAPLPHDTCPLAGAASAEPPRCPTTGRPETRPDTRRGDPETVCKGIASICRGKSRKASKKGEIR
jgi:hypothetical protein